MAQQIPAEIVEAAGGDERKIAELMGLEDFIDDTNMDICSTDDFFNHGLKLTRMKTRPLTAGALFAMESLMQEKDVNDILSGLLYLITEMDLEKLQQAVEKGECAKRGAVLMFELTVPDLIRMKGYLERVVQIITTQLGGGEDDGPFVPESNGGLPISTPSQEATAGSENTSSGNSPTSPDES